MNGATTTSVEALDTSPGRAVNRRSEAATEARSASQVREQRKAFQRKYRHITAIHSESQPSCLSHDSVVSPSFLGFRNLGFIVLGKASAFGTYSRPISHDDGADLNHHQSLGTSAS